MGRPGTQKDEREKNKAIVRRMLEAFNTGDTNVVAELIDTNVKDKSRFANAAPELRNKRVVQRVQTEVMAESKAFPDKKFKEELIVAEGDTVVLRWSMTGTHNGTLIGKKATGKKIKVFGTEFVRIKNGKIVEHADDGMHTLDVLRQLEMFDPEILSEMAQEDAVDLTSEDNAVTGPP